MMHKDQRQKFGMLYDRALRAYEQLKPKLTSPLILALPKKRQAKTMETDTHDETVGVALRQDQAHGSLKPIKYFSRTFTEAEQNYEKTELEYLAVVRACLLLQSYIE